MTENKRFTVHIVWLNYDKTEGEITLRDNGQPLLECDCVEDVQMVKGLLNELHEENQSLKFDNKELIRFIKSKGYTLKDYIKFIGQFQSVGVNKEDWE